MPRRPSRLCPRLSTSWLMSSSGMPSGRRLNGMRVSCHPSRRLFYPSTPISSCPHVLPHTMNGSSRLILPNFRMIFYFFWTAANDHSSKNSRRLPRINGPPPTHAHHHPPTSRKGQAGLVQLARVEDVQPTRQAARRAGAQRAGRDCCSGGHSPLSSSVHMQ